MAKSKIVTAADRIGEIVTDGYKKIEESTIHAYKKIEKGAVKTYKKIEQGAVRGFTKLSDGFVDQFLTKEGESVEDAKKRIAREQAIREEAAKKGRM